jgi:hypothetical protein
MKGYKNKQGKFIPTGNSEDKKAKIKYHKAMKQLAGKDGKIDLNNGDVYNEYGKIRDEYNEQKWRRQGLSDEEIYQKWEESQ